MPSSDEAVCGILAPVTNRFVVAKLGHGRRGRSCRRKPGAVAVRPSWAASRVQASPPPQREVHLFHLSGRHRRCIVAGCASKNFRFGGFASSGRRIGVVTDSCREVVVFWSRFGGRRIRRPGPCRCNPSIGPKTRLPPLWLLAAVRREDLRARPHRSVPEARKSARRRYRRGTCSSRIMRVVGEGGEKASPRRPSRNRRRDSLESRKKPGAMEPSASRRGWCRFRRLAAA